MLFVLTGCGGEKDAENLPEIKTGVNIVVNPSFEEWDGFMPTGWKLRQFAGEGENINMFGKNSEHHVNGKYSYFLRGLFNTDKWMVLSQKHPVRPGYDVIFSAEIKTLNIKKSRGQEDNTNIFLTFYDEEGKRVNDRYYADAWTKRRIGTSKWTRNRFKKSVPDKARSMEIGLLNQMTGYAYFDDITLVILEQLKWETRKTKFITFKWDQEKVFPKEDMDKLTKLIESIARDMGIKKIEDRISYLFYPSEEKILKVTGMKKYRQVTNWKKKELHTLESNENHDLVHLILYDLGAPPVGLAKGVVFYFREEYNGWDLHNAAKQDLVAKRLPALYKTIPYKVFKNSAVSVTVPSWGSFVKYMIEKYGIKKMVRLYRAVDEINDFEPFNVHFKDIYGEEFPKIDQEWRLFLLRYECDAAADTLL